MIPRTLRRLPRNTLNLLDSTIVEQVSRNSNPVEMIMYMSISIAIGGVAISLGDWFTPLIFVGCAIMVASILVPLMSYSLEWLTHLNNYTRAFGDSKISATLHYEIRDLLYDRGIRNPKRYIREHPDHCESVLQCIADLYSTSLTEWDAVVALVFARDENPDATREAILYLIKERGDMRACDVRSLLEIRNATASPLMDGAL